jgi:hypothetical protein
LIMQNPNFKFTLPALIDLKSFPRSYNPFSSFSMI